MTPRRQPSPYFSASSLRLPSAAKTGPCDRTTKKRLKRERKSDAERLTSPDTIQPWDRFLTSDVAQTSEERCERLTSMTCARLAAVTCVADVRRAFAWQWALRLQPGVALFEILVGPHKGDDFSFVGGGSKNGARARHALTWLYLFWSEAGDKNDRTAPPAASLFNRKNLIKSYFTSSNPQKRILVFWRPKTFYLCLKNFEGFLG